MTAADLTGSSVSGRFRRSLLETLHVVHAVSMLDAVGIVTEAGEPPIPLSQRPEVAQIRTIVGPGCLAGHEHRNTGRIGNHTGREHPVAQLLERDVLDLA